MEDGWYLGIESSTEDVSVALVRGREVVAQAAVRAERKPSVVMPERLRDVLQSLPAGARLEAVVVGTGPASYNGARVGIAAGQGVAMVSGCPAVGVCSLEAVAAVRAGDDCLALGDARRESFFTLPLQGGALAGSAELSDHEAFAHRVDASPARLISFEAVERLRLRAEVAGRVGEVRPEAHLLVEAWNAKPEAVRAELAAVPPQPFYLREPYVTKAAS